MADVIDSSIIVPIAIFVAESRPVHMQVELLNLNGFANLVDACTAAESIRPRYN